MSSDPKRPDVGDLVVDATDLAGIIIDLPPGKRLGLRTPQPGFDEVVGEVRANQPTFGAQAGLRDEDVAAIDEDLAQRAEIQARLPAARKMVELLEETGAVIDDRLQRRVFSMAQTIEARARMLGDDELLGRYAKTREYRSSVGNKAARTRLRNQADQGDAGELPEQPGPVDEASR
jgi:hypothetical protein